MFKLFDLQCFICTLWYGDFVEAARLQNVGQTKALLGVRAVCPGKYYSW